MFPTVIQMHDDELRRRVIHFLVARGITHSAELQVTAARSVIVLRGQAGSEHEKLLALQCCRRVAGVVRVVDRLKVPPATSASVDESTTQTIRIIYDEWIT